MAIVLIVDDDADIRRLLRRFLEAAGHRVVEADSAAVAMTAALKDPPPDVVVCDVVMPGKSGLAFYGDLVDRAPQFRERVIFLTGAAHDRAVHDRIEQLGAPLIAKLDDLQLVVDAVKIAVLRK
jgi:DNA-binding NtrC family response regulator